MRFNPQKILIESGTKWEMILMQPLRERGEYLQTRDELTYKQVAGVFLGAFEDQEAFL